MPNSYSGGQNRILEQLSPVDRETLLRHAKRYPLAHGEVLYEAGGLIQYVYFPLSGMISLLTIVTSGDAIETGIVGREGMIGGSVGTDGKTSFGQALVQIAGAAVRIPAAVFREQYEACTALRTLINRYQSFILVQAQQSAACHAIHTVEARLCRRLLQSRGTLGSDTVNLTQDFLSHMLGVQRSTVSLSAHALQQAGLIRYSRGKVQIVDAFGLEESACECYRIVQNELEKILQVSNPPAG